MRKLIIIDNYDSFTYTIKHYFETLKVSTEVIKNDDKRLKNVSDLHPTHIVLSPGPGHPDDAGYTIDVIKKYYKRYPILGICLGHQCIMQAFGGTIINADEIMHGKISKISHTGEGLFADLPNDFTVARYHSLVVDKDTIPAEFKLTGWTYDKAFKKVAMAFEHKKYPLFGVQYHPEAILTEHGYAQFKIFLDNRAHPESFSLKHNG